MVLDSNTDECASDHTPAVWAVPAALRFLAECGETEVVDELIALFQTDAALRLERIGRAAAAADYAAVRQEAHSLRGAAGQIGAGEVARLCLELELAAGNSPPAGLPGLVLSLARGFEEVRGAMAARPPSPPIGNTRYGQ